MIKRIVFAVLVILIALSTLVITASNYYANVYGSDYLNEILFYVATGLEGADFSAITDFVKSELILYFIVFLVLLLPLLNFKKRYSALVEINNKERNIRVFPFFQSLIGKSIYSIVILAASLLYAYYTTEIDVYLSTTREDSSFIEDYYIDPDDVSITFPEEKQNLIVIYLESMEPTMMSETNGGAWGYSVMPELESLAMNHINFSNTDMLGGMLPAIGTTWTVAGLVSTSAGIPLRVAVGGNDYKSDNLLSGATTLGDILYEENYNSKFIFGSDAKYGGRYQYYTNHGNYEIFDVNTAIERGYMTEDDKVFWGFEDEYLFEWAKDELLELAAEDDPFNFGMLTVNTHFPDGWLEEGAEENFPTQYENVHAHSSKQVAAFIEWVQAQDFYDNTTIVLVGDHKSMQADDYYDNRIPEDYTRVVFNTIINSKVEAVREKERDFTSFDLFPSILASIGATIEGDRLGLGTNLFSDELTLAEELGIEEVNLELNRKSTFYNQKFLGADYFELQKQRRELEKEKEGK